MKTNLQTMEKLIDIFNIHNTSLREKRLGVMKSFLSEYERVSDSLTQRVDAQPNMLKILNVITDEVRHTSFLAWLLDASSNHGQDRMFFDALLNLCSIDLVEEFSSDYKVLKEFPQLESIIDILIYRRGGFIIYLENKIVSAEGIDQCSREIRDMNRLGTRLNIPEDRRFAVLLSPTGREPVTCDARLWRTLSYAQL